MLCSRAEVIVLAVAQRPAVVVIWYCTAALDALSAENEIQHDTLLITGSKNPFMHRVSLLPVMNEFELCSCQKLLMQNYKILMQLIIKQH